MKNKKNLWLIGGCAIVLVIAIILCAVLIPGKEKPEITDTSSETTTESSEPATSDIIPDIPDDSGEKSEESEDDSDTSSESSGLTVDTSESEVSEGASLPDDTSKAELPAKPVKPEDDSSKPQPEETSKPETPPVKVYSCGCENHNCENEEYHKGLLAREKEGCPYCGSHECISFYAVDKWGYTIYDPTICPNYDVKSDPYKYCQTCGKKVGDGRNGTCAVFVVDVDCPNCGEHVHAWECHTCK